MLSPGDVVFLDGDEKKKPIGKRWTVRAAAQRGDLNISSQGESRAYYQFVGWPDPNEWVPSSRITAHWVES